MRGFLVLLGPDGPPPDDRPDSHAWAATGVRMTVGTGAALVRRGPLVAVAALRLDNRDEIRSALGGPSPEAGPTGDAALLLAAVEAWGPGAAARLDGPFAFAVWDERTQEVLFARDALGLRPLFFARAAHPVVLGTDLAEVRSHAPAGLSPEAVADHLAGTFAHPWQTLTAAVERVPPGHIGTASTEAGTVDVRPYATIGPVPPLRFEADAPYADAFREAFDRAVSDRLGGDPAAFLSGGLDSSSIVVTARAVRPGAPLPTLSIVYEHPAADERRFVDAVAVEGEAHRVDGATLSLLGGLDADLEAVGEPFPTPNLFLTRSLYDEARRLGHDAMLDGFAGDSVVGHGDAWLTDLAHGLRWTAFAREARAVAARMRRPRRAALHLVRDYALAPLVRRETAARTFAHPDLPRPPTPASAPRTARALHHAEVAGPALPRAFEVAYAVATAHGVEPRFPFADRRLVDLCLALPPEQRLRDGLTRWVLRQAMSGRLPDILRDRTDKARLGGLFADALFDREPEVLRRIVYEDIPAAADLLDVPAVHAAYERAHAHPEARAGSAAPLWRAVALARWLALSR